MLKASRLRLTSKSKLAALRQFATSKNTEQSKALYNKIIHASFINAKNYGFNDQAIAAACCDLNLPSVTGGILPNGAYDVVTFALDHWLKAMKEDLSEFSTTEDDKVLTFKDLSTRD
jgi:ubiquinone biosynthesis protein COQ9